MSESIQREIQAEAPRARVSWRLVAIALVGLIALIALALVARLYFRTEATSASAARDPFKKLGIEKPDKPIAAPNFTLKDLSGKEMSLGELRGKVVFLNFWATWCVPCRQEMPAMEKLHRELKDQGLAVVAIDFREDGNAVQEFFIELGLTFQAALDTEGEVSEKYGAWSLPLTYIIDRKGEFVGKTIGERKWDGEDARTFFRGLLEEKN